MECGHSAERGLQVGQSKGRMDTQTDRCGWKAAARAGPREKAWGGGSHSRGRAMRVAPRVPFRESIDWPGTQKVTIGVSRGSPQSLA